MSLENFIYFELGENVLYLYRVSHELNVVFDSWNNLRNLFENLILEVKF